MWELGDMITMNHRIFSTITIIILLTSVLIGSNFFISSLTASQDVPIQRQAIESPTSITKSITTANMSITNSTMSTDSVGMLVMRITNNTNAIGVNYSAIRIVSPEVVSKYPLLQSALEAADKQLDDFNKQCQNSQCENSLPLRITPGYNGKIPTTVAKVIIEDPDLHFSKYPSLPKSVQFSYIQTNNIIYSIYLQVPQ